MFQALDYFGVVVFAITGCLVAARRRVDIIGFIWLASVTGIGGGTVRDLILNRPVFWVDAPFYLILCFGTAISMFFLARWVHRYAELILWFDAIGLAVFAVLGTHIALLTGVNQLVAFLMGIMTATLGGVLRDVLAGEPTLIMRREIYVTAAGISAGLYLLLFAYGGLNFTPAAALACFAGFFVRALALKYRIMLPGYHWLEPQSTEAPYPERRNPPRP